MLEFCKRIIRQQLYLRGWNLIPRGAFGYDLWTDIRQMKPAGAFKLLLDVGASRGQTAECFLELFPAAKVHCFEPHEDSFRILQERFGSNKRVVLHQLGLGDRAGETELNLCASSDCNSFLEVGAKTFDGHPSVLFESRGRQKTEMARLDGIMAREGLEHIDILKVDTQGFDLSVLRGGGEYLNPGRISFIVLEVFFTTVYRQQTRIEEVFQLLEKAGFRFGGVYNVARNPGTHAVTWADVLFLGD